MENDFTQKTFSRLSSDNLPSLSMLFSKKCTDLNISMRQAEVILGIDRKVISNILDRSNKKIDVVSLIKLGGFINLPFDETLKIFTASLPVEEIIEIQDAKRRTYLVENFDLKGLKAIKFIESTTDFESIENRLKEFFGLNSLYDYTRIIGVAYSKVNKNYNNRMVDFWNQSASSSFEKIDNPNSYDRRRLIEIIPHIRPYSQDVENGLRVVSRALFEIGVTLIFQPYIAQTQMRGATFIINDKPCIVITNRNKNYATLWFALLHELYHVLFEYDKIEKSVFHLTGELNLEFVDEDAANDFARQYFLSYEKSKYIFPYIDDPGIIKRYASKNKIHPSLIYNFYCYDANLGNNKRNKKNYWMIYNRFMISTEQSTKNLNTDIYSFKTIEQGVLSGMKKLQKLKNGE